MKILVCFGMAFRLTEKNYKKALESIRDTGGVDIEKLGTRIGESLNITDMTSNEAAEKLEALNDRTRTR